MNKDFTEFLEGRLYAHLFPFGFKKRGKHFSRTINDLTQVISIQSSRASTSDTLIFTINIEVRSSILYSLQETSLKENQVVHYSKRIGSYLEPPTDKWWKVIDNKSLLSASSEMDNLIKNKVLVDLSQLNSINDLERLLLNNTCPGLTEYQRKEYLALLKATDD
jgi:hypothetical protein